MATSTSQILIRTPRELHEQLLIRSKNAEQSLNEFCLDKLRCPSSLDGQAPHMRKVLEEASRILGPELLGLILYGSRARGEANAGSDWDFLLLIDATRSLNRQLYRWWEEQSEGSLPPEIEINFTHLPESLGVATGFWSEIALDGIVIYERNFVASQYLNRVRRSMAEGRIVRRTAHGQAYWVYREVA